MRGTCLKKKRKGIHKDFVSFVKDEITRMIHTRGKGHSLRLTNSTSTLGEVKG